MLFFFSPSAGLYSWYSATNGISFVIEHTLKPPGCVTHLDVSIFSLVISIYRKCRVVNENVAPETASPSIDTSPGLIVTVYFDERNSLVFGINCKFFVVIHLNLPSVFGAISTGMSF